MASFLGPLPASNFEAGRGGRDLTFGGAGDPRYIVIHTMSGTIATTDTMFKNPGSSASSHYGIGLDGSVVQWVQESDTAFHAGNPNVNQISIGIHHDDGGNVGGQRTDALYSAASLLVRDICFRHGIPVTRQWIIKHLEVPQVTTTCPDALDVDRIVAMASAPSQPEAAPVTATAAAVARSTATGSVVPAIATSPPQPVEPAVSETPPPPALARSQPAPAPPEVGAPSDGASATTDKPAPISVAPASPATQPAPAPTSAPAPAVATGDPMRDMAAAIYGDPGRWREISQSIQAIVDEVPVIQLAAKLMAGPPTTAAPPASGPIAPPAGPLAPPAGPVAPPAGPVAPPAGAGGGPPQAQQKLWGGSQGAVFTLQIVYLTILAALAIIYFVDRSLIDLPQTLGPVPVPVPWFGALGAVLISLVGITDHRHDWDPAYRYWHWARPLLGASFGTISVLIFQAGILAVGTPPSASASSAPKDLLYYLIAFVVGYREETFRDLIKRLIDVVFSTAQTGATISVSSMAPQSGPAAGGTSVTILGGGLDNTDNVQFGSAQAAFRIDGDGQLTVTSPSGQAGTTVNVTAVGKGASAIAGHFSYT